MSVGLLGGNNLPAKALWTISATTKDISVSLGYHTHIVTFCVTVLCISSLTDRSKYELRKHYFTHRIVSVWNSLPDSVVSAESVLV